MKETRSASAIPAEASACGGLTVSGEESKKGFISGSFALHGGNQSHLPPAVGMAPTRVWSVKNGGNAHNLYQDPRCKHVMPGSSSACGASKVTAKCPEDIPAKSRK